MTLIRLSLAAMLLAATAAPAAANQTDDTFAAFKRVCGDTRADYAAATTASAGTSGWRPSQVMASPMPGVTVSERQGRTMSLNDATLVVSMTHGAAAKDPSVNVYTCTLQTDRGGFPDLKNAVQAWLGFDPASTTDTSATYRFTEENGHLRAAAASEFDAAASGTGMQIVTVKRDGNSAIIDYVKIKK